jgi:alkylation response protein AidB-like acyl-CoA dehydrogenase
MGAVRVDAGDADAQAASLAKARCSDTAILVANEAIQMHAASAHGRARSASS